ncbi:hypothetical protein L249_5711 [Ophiocordyceps polyrhachis-furcata BCC 54312]|uniref:Uncharacterized protein n=1 Tax=Ophiocordyceps polyrhachis-furcata BCC 54312 TaxID=1330021 RepID=A0A367KZW7_9HYPO|nr:hypothetical protein L249_5711 [Ophiocordyceps polyrhachis-furcata BCC 54312]
MADSVGSLLAAIALLLADGLRILDLADKRHWGADEHEQRRALDEALDEARKDFQELAPLVHGQAHYELDRRHESLQELRMLRSRCRDLVFALKDWTRCGGPINPVWVVHTHSLQRDLHRAQCRAARRIFTSDRESSARCLGAFLLLRRGRTAAGVEAVGTFERFSDEDVVFVCDFCDGHLVWHDVEAVPLLKTATTTTTSGSPTSISTTTTTTTTTTTNVTTAIPPLPFWQTPALSTSSATPKTVISPLVAIANHVPPPLGDWLAPLLCPYCEDEARRPHDDDDDDEADAYRAVSIDEFDDLEALQLHFEAYHPASSPVDAGGSSCLVM